MQPTWDWQQEGFQRRPTPHTSVPGEKLYRVWGGGSSLHGRAESVGVCFSTASPTSRREAENPFAVFEYGNSCAHVTEFIVPAGTLLWMGDVDPGDARAELGFEFGPQVFIENPAAQSLVVIATRNLVDDLGGSSVHTGRKVRIHS